MWASPSCWWPTVWRRRWTTVLYAVLVHMYISIPCSIQVEEEIYDLLSFLSESGGALGLLLGFSLFTLWDLLQPLVSLLTRRVCSAI